jgi:hypothetical protein
MHHQSNDAAGGSLGSIGPNRSVWMVRLRAPGARSTVQVYINYSWDEVEAGA